MRKIERLIPDCLILRGDPRDVQGLPDLIILYKNKWAALEVKASNKANIQPNQAYYVETLGAMSFASFINPDNEEEVLSDLQHTFGLSG